MKSNNQRETASKLTFKIIEEYELPLNDCPEGHASEIMHKYLIRSTINTLLNNYCKRVNDTPKPDTKKRKLATFKNK